MQQSVKTQTTATIEMINWKNDEMKSIRKEIIKISWLLKRFELPQHLYEA